MSIKSIVDDDYYVALDPDGVEISRGSKKDKRYVDIITHSELHGVSGEYRIIQPEVKVGLIGASPGVQPPNFAPEWTSTPAIEWVTGVGGTYDLLDDTFDPEGDTLTFTLAAGSTALPTGVTLNSNGTLTATGSVVVGATTGILFDCDDGTAAAVESPSITINVSDPISTTIWPEQDASGYSNPAAVRNRNGSGALFTAEGRGFGMDTRHAYTQFNVGAQTGTSPTIVHITSRADSGAGTIRAAIEGTSGPMILVFDVGGTFTISSSINGNSPFMASDVWIAGQTAPSQVVIDKTGVGNRFYITGSNVFVQHVVFWHSAAAENPGTEDDNANSMTITGPGTLPGSFRENLVFDHCYFGGGTDQTQLVFDDCADITFIDCLFANPRGKNPGVDRSHKYNQQIGTSSSADAKIPDNISIIGCVYTNGRERNPTVISANFTMANSLIYNRESKAVDIRGTSAQTLVCNINVVGVWDKRGPQYASNAGVIQLGRSGQQAFGAGSLVFVNDCYGATYSSDEWDVVDDFDSQEGDHRQNTVVTAGWPTGLVAASVRTLSDADKIELMTQNVGPRPNARLADIQTDIDHIINGTDGSANDYTVPGSTNTSSAYSEPGSPHTEGSESGRTVIEEDLLDKAEAFLV